MPFVAQFAPISLVGWTTNTSYSSRRHTHHIIKMCSSRLKRCHRTINSQNVHLKSIGESSLLAANGGLPRATTWFGSFGSHIHPTRKCSSEPKPYTNNDDRSCACVCVPVLMAPRACVRLNEAQGTCLCIDSIHFRRTHTRVRHVCYARNGHECECVCEHATKVLYLARRKKRDWDLGTSIAIC